MTTIASQFGKRLRDLREAKGFAAARHFARALGIPENRYTRYERGVSEPNIDLIYRICSTLAISPDELFAAKGNRDAPGFSSGPQQAIGVSEISQAVVNDRRLAPDRVASALPHPGLERGQAQDAAAWRLAAAIVRHLAAQASETRAPRPTLATLAETGRLFTALRNTPYETVSRIAVDGSIQALPDPAAAELQALVEEYLALLS